MCDPVVPNHHSTAAPTGHLTTPVPLPNANVWKADLALPNMWGLRVHAQYPRHPTSANFCSPLEKP